MSESNQEQTTPKTTISLWAFLALFITAVIIVGLYTTHGNLAAAWQRATTAAPETYSELYFLSPATLPTYAPARKSEVVSFRIVNHEATARAFTYQTTVTINGITSTHVSTISLTNGQSATESVAFVMPKPLETATIAIKLVGTTQEISFRSQS